MIRNFLYHVPTKVYFGRGAASQLSVEAAPFDSVLFVYGKGSIRRSGLYDKILSYLKSAGTKVYELGGIGGNPEIAAVREGVRLCKEKKISAIVAAGGGSVMDTGKVIAAASTVETDAWDLISKRIPVARALPVLAVTTAAATGSEMNGSAVITNPVTAEKFGYSSPKIRPMAAFLDPENTFTVPAYQTACGSADIMSHTMEDYFHKGQGFGVTDSFMEGLLRSVILNAPKAMKTPDDYDARAELLWDAVWAINDFTSCGAPVPWSCHGMEHELSARFGIVHGHGLAILTPRWMEYVLSEETAPRLAQFARNVFGVTVMDDVAAAKEGIDSLADFFFVTLGLASRLRDLPVDRKDFRLMAERAVAWKGKEGVIPGFAPLTAEDVEKIYELSW